MNRFPKVRSVKSDGLPDLVTFCKSAARDVFAKTGKHLPTIVAKVQGKLEIYGAVFDGQDSKNALEVFLLELALTADEIVFISEVWRMEYTPEDVEADRAKVHGLANVPGRTEAICLNHATPMSQAIHFATINRVVNGPAVLSPWEGQEMESPEGRFANLFQRARKHERN